MKNLKTFFLLMLGMFFVFSCRKEESADIKLDEAKMSSFGFYASDNPGIILKDYVVENINSKNVTILLPEDVDKSKLIARYIVSDNNMVKVSNVLQSSGKTVNDFTIPIDYILMGGNNNAKYTVTVGKAPAFIWQAIPYVYEDSLTSMTLKVNPVTGVPHLMYKEYRKISAEQKAAMAVFENNNWKNIGEISDGQIGTYFDVAFNSKGIPYASYADYTASIAQANTVKRSNGAGTWELVGNKPVTSGRVSFNALSFVNDSKLFLFSVFDATSGALARRELDISVFENNAWTTNITMSGRTSDMVTYLPAAVQQGEAVYLGILNAITPNSFSIYRFQNGTWTTLLDKWKDPNATGMTIRDFDIDADQNGNVYVAFADNSRDAVLKHRVVKYDASTQTVSAIGNYLPGASGGLFSFDLAISPLGTPYLFYRNENNYAAITYLDKETKEWTTPYIFESQVVDELNLDFAPNGEAYVAYLKNRKLFAYKYVAP